MALVLEWAALLGIDIGRTSVGKYMVRLRQPPSQTWRTFLDNHIKSLVSVDFFTVPMIGIQILYVFVVLAHDRRRILHFNVTAPPTAEWTGQQLEERNQTRARPFLLVSNQTTVGAAVRAISRRTEFATVTIPSARRFLSPRAPSRRWPPTSRCPSVSSLSTQAAPAR